MKRLFIGLLVCSLALFVFLSAFEFKNIVGTGMEPSLTNGQYILLSKFGVNSLERSSVVSYKKMNGPSSIGRIVGLPTESVRIENGHLYIDDNTKKWRLEEEYLTPDLLVTSTSEGKWLKIDKFEYFVLQDNKRSNIPLDKMIVKKSEIESTLLFKFPNSDAN